MCKCKKAMSYEFVLTWCDGDDGDDNEPASWLVCLYATCTRCGDDNNREPIDDATIDDVPGSEIETEVDVQMAMQAMLPKGVKFEDVKVTHETM